MQRYDLSCGAAAIATLLTYQHGDAVAETAVAHAMLRATDPAKVKARGGFSLLEMKRYVESRGYRGAGYRELTFEQLERLGPAIVTIDAGGGQYKHFVVFNGTLADRVRLADPAFGHRTMTRTAFERAWVGRLAFVVRSPDTPMRRLAQGPRQLPIPSDSLIRQAMP